MSTTPSSRPWRLEWYYFGDCACVWKGEHRDLLWSSLFSFPAHVPDRIRHEDNADNGLSLIGTIERLMRGNRELLRSKWKSWHKGIQVVSRVWPEGRGPETNPPVDVVLEKNRLILFLSERIGGDYSFKVSDRNKNGARVKIESPDGTVTRPFRVKAEKVDKEHQLWLNPYMQVVDTQLLMEDDTFRDELERIDKEIQDRNERSEAIIDAINQGAGRLGYNSQPFLDDYPLVNQYDVDTSWKVSKSTFSRNGSGLALKLGFKRKTDQLSVTTEKNSRRLVPDYPCGNILARSEVDRITY